MALRTIANAFAVLFVAALAQNASAQQVKPYPRTNVTFNAARAAFLPTVERSHLIGKLKRQYLPAGVGPGVRLRVTGDVDLFNDVLEIIPQAGADVVVR